LEGDRFYDFHIHYATERSQQSGNREDAYAEPTDRYATLDEALACLFSDCAFIFPDDDQPRLFDIWPRRSQ
jgi:hypothetical protein